MFVLSNLQHSICACWVMESTKQKLRQKKNDVKMDINTHNLRTRSITASPNVDVKETKFSVFNCIAIFLRKCIFNHVTCSPL